MCSGIQKARGEGSKPSSGGIIRLLRQKSNPGHGPSCARTAHAPWRICTMPSKLPITATKSAAAIPQNTGGR